MAESTHQVSLVWDKLVFCTNDGRVAELVYALALGASGSNPLRVRVSPRPPFVQNASRLGGMGAIPWRLVPHHFSDVFIV